MDVRGGERRLPLQSSEGGYAPLGLPRPHTPPPARDGASSASSYALDLALAEEPVGPEHEDDHEGHEGGHLLHPSAEDRIEIPAREVLQHADQHTADDGADHAVEAAQDDDRKHLQAEVGEREVEDPAPD